MNKREIKITLNGKEYSLEVKAHQTLLQVLREDLQLTATKYSCGIGECGACTVLINGESHLSCLTLSPTVHGKNIQTLEGLESNKGLHPIQEAFISEDAFACGFCTPGMIMSALDLLQRGPKPTQEEIMEGLAGNICRCTGYYKIIKAVGKAAQQMKERK